MLHYLYHSQPPFIAGITCAKSVAFLLGLLVFVVLSFFEPEISLVKRLALLFWYPTIAGVAAATNALDLTTFKPFCWRWWQRTVLIGAWLNLVVVLFTSDTMQNFSMVVLLSFGQLTSPFWFVMDGAMIGFIAGYTSNKAQQRTQRRNS